MPATLCSRLPLRRLHLAQAQAVFDQRFFRWINLACAAFLAKMGSHLFAGTLAVVL